MEKNLELLHRLIALIGNVTLAEAVTWAEVEENAQKLIGEVKTDESSINDENRVG